MYTVQITLSLCIDFLLPYLSCAAVGGAISSCSVKMREKYCVISLRDKEIALVFFFLLHQLQCTVVIGQLYCDLSLVSFPLHIGKNTTGDSDDRDEYLIAEVRTHAGTIQKCAYCA